MEPGTLSVFSAENQKPSKTAHCVRRRRVGADSGECFERMELRQNPEWLKESKTGLDLL